MKKILSAAAVALAFAVSASAQATTPSQSPSQTQPSPSSTAGQKVHKGKATRHDEAGMKPTTVTLTGCLRQGSTPDSFELDNAQVSSAEMPSMHTEHSGAAPEPSTSATQPSSQPTSPAAGSQAGTSASAGMMTGELGNVKLVPSADIDLKDHVGHKVEVRGTMAASAGRGMARDKESATSDTMGSGTSASSSSATGTSGSSKDAHTLRIRSFRHISDTCSQ